MAKNQGEIRFGIGFNVNQQSLSNVKKALDDLKKMSLKDISAAGGNILPLSKMHMASDKNHLHEMREELGKLEQAFEAAYNPKLGTYELNKFNASLKESGTSAAQVFSVVANMGAQGQAALLDMTSGMLAVNRAGKQTNETFKKLGDTMLNTLRWSLTSTALNAVTSAIQQAFHYAADLDKSLNDIMIVTDKSSSEMERFAQQANKAAKALGTSTKDYTEASLIYYQQGLGDKDVEARTNTTLKTAAVTGQSASAVSEQLTAVWNGYKVSAAESEKYIDKLAAVAASTAADLEELSTGMSKVAAAANVMGVDVDQLNAQLATIVSVTREAPESIGTALKTVYARMSDIEAGLDTETTLGEYTSQMAAMGVNVLDTNGKLRDMGAVVEEIGNKWASLNREQQVSLAQSIAGTRQYSRMMALFDNWDMYQETLATSAESAGALTQQHIKYLNSIEAHQNKLKASAEGLYDSIFDSDSIKGVYDVLAKLVDGASVLVKSIGGMPGILASIALITTTIGKNSIQEMLMKRQTNKLQQEIYKAQITNGQKTIEQLSAEIQLTGEVKERYNDILKLEERIYANADNLTDEGWNNLQAGVNQYIETLKIAIDAEKEVNDLQKEKTQVDKELDGTGLKYNFSGAKGDARRIQAQNRVKNLRAKTTNSKLSDKEKKAATEELAREEKYIKLGEKRIELSKKIANAESKKKKIIEGVNESLKEQNAALNSNIDALEKFSKVSDVIQGLSGVAFQAALASGAVSSFSSALHDSNAGMGDWIGAFGSALGVIGSFIPMITTTTKKFRKLRAAQADQSKANLVGALSWEAYWAAATMGIAAAITIITTLASAIGASNQAMLDKADAAIEAERETQKELKATQKLEKSYLDLYEAYVETGQGKDEMVTAADAVIDALESETLQVTKEAEAYGELAQKIREKMLAQQDDVIKSATEEKNAAENKLNTVKQGKLKGIRRGANPDDGDPDTWSVIGSGLSTSDKESENIQLLGKVFKDSGLLHDTPGENSSFLSLKSMDAMTAEEKARLYKLLKETTQEKGWKTDKNNKINTNVQAILNDEDFAAAYADYITAVKTESKEQVRKSILETDYSKSTSFTQFNEQREEWIKELQEAQDIDYDTAAAQVNNLYAEAGGYGATLNERLKWAKGKESALGSKLSVDLLSDALELASMGDAEYDALKTLNIENYNSAKDLAVAAREKALENQEAYWASLSTEHLKSLTTQLEKYEKQAEKTFGKKKLTAIQEQSKALEAQRKILEGVISVEEKAAENARENVLTVATNAGIRGLNQETLMGLMSSEDWEGAKQYITNAVGDLDKRQLLITALGKAIDAQNQLNESSQELNDIIDEQAEKRLQIIDTIQEQYDIEIEYLNDINALLESQAELYELLYGDKAYQQQSDLADKMLQIAQNNEQAAQQAYLSSYAAYQDAFEKSRDKYTDADREKIAHEMAADTAAYLEAVNNTIRKAQERYQKDILKSFANFEQRLAGKTIDDLQEDLDWTVGLNDRYLDGTQTALSKQKLINEFAKAGQNASIKGQKQINKLLQDELAALNQKDRLTEKDLDMARQRLNVLQAQIALEEAQHNKNQMRLVRGADGTYSYEYTINESQVLDLETQLLESTSGLYDIELEAYEESLQDWFTLYQEWRDKVIQLAEEGYSQEEIATRMQPFTDELTKRAKEVDGYKTTFQTSLGTVFKDLETQSNGIPSLLDTSLSAFVEKFGDEGTTFPTIASDLLEEISSAYASYCETIDQKAELIETALNGADGESGVNGALYSQFELIANNTDKVNTLADAYARLAAEMAKLDPNTSINTETNPVVQKATLKEKQMQASGDSNINPNPTPAVHPTVSIPAAPATPTNAVGAAWYSGGTATYTTDKTPNGTYSLSHGTIVGSKSSSPYYVYSNVNGDSNLIPVEIDANQLEGVKLELEGNPDGTGVLITWINGQEYVKGTFSKNVKNKINKEETYYVPKSTIYSTERKHNGAMLSFDTGGYTGNWNSSDGKLAMLHEKELILKKEDTANFLSALDILRSLNLSMLANMAQLANVQANHATNWTTNDTAIAQTVEIHAEFPNVTDKNEIEEAFDNLVNRAVQHAFRTTIE